VDKIKIDRSFVNQLSDDAGSQSIVLAMVDLAKALGVEVTAEGVETSAQKSFLSKAGCDQLQGFLFSRPQSAEIVGELLEKTHVIQLRSQSRVTRAVPLRYGA
jgi:EAL domain-containing protein (putative c-di-GMP-specific phosphodiesterase class I)